MPTAPPGVIEALRPRLRDIRAEAAHIVSLLTLYGVPVDEGQDEPQQTKRQPSTVARSRKGQVSDQWRPLYDMMLAHGDDMSVDSLVAFSERESLGFERQRIRDQMHNWKRQGLVVSSAPSVFRAVPRETHNGAEPEASAPLSEFDGRSEPNAREASRFDLLNPSTGDAPGGGT